MQQDKHIYIIIGLLVLILIGIIWIIKLETATVAELVKDSNESIAECRANISEWSAEHPQGPADDADRAELSTILSNCSAAIGEAQPAN